MHHNAVFWLVACLQQTITFWSWCHTSQKKTRVWVTKDHDCILSDGDPKIKLLRSPAILLSKIITILIQTCISKWSLVIFPLPSSYDQIRLNNIYMLYFMSFVKQKKKKYVTRTVRQTDITIFTDDFSSTNLAAIAG